MKYKNKPALPPITDLPPSMTVDEMSEFTKLQEEILKREKVRTERAIIKAEAQRERVRVIEKGIDLRKDMADVKLGTSDVNDVNVDDDLLGTSKSAVQARRKWLIDMCVRTLTGRISVDVRRDYINLLGKLEGHMVDRKEAAKGVSDAANKIADALERANNAKRNRKTT